MPAWMKKASGESHVAVGRGVAASMADRRESDERSAGVARFLVDECGVDVRQVNHFECGAAHWLGTVPLERAGANGDALLPTA